MKKHKWFHFIYGKQWKEEVIFKSEIVETKNCWYECKRCKEQVGKKEGYTRVKQRFIVELDK
jgi:hypothetical protein